MDRKSAEAKARALVSQMTLREKAKGQSASLRLPGY